MILERIHGIPLKQILEFNICTSIIISPIAVAGLMHPIMESLDILHNNNIIHSNIRPDNIMIDFNTQKITLFDFSAHRFYDEHINEYMCDIIIEDQYKAIDRRLSHCDISPSTDVYSLAVIIYELITNRRLIEAGARRDIIASKRCKDPALEIKKYVPSIDKHFNKAMVHALSVTPDKRTQDIKSFMIELGMN